MKIIYLNCYSGQLRKPLFEFIQNNSSDTDIFCFQEVSVSLQKEISEILINFNSVLKLDFYFQTAMS